MEAKPGDKVRIKTDSEELKGILIPSTEFDNDVIIIKLESGYNIGIDKAKIQSMKVIENFSPSHVEIKVEKQNEHLPKISVLHTGGTIASKVDYQTGGVSAKFSETELLALFPELKNIGNISSKLIRNMFSEDMRFSHYNIMAQEIEKEIEKGAEGIIITHGTDTLHYSASALAFILEGLKAPVILVGAQRSSDRGSSDAGLNLISAAYFIANTDFAGVAMCMHETMSDNDCVILPAMKSRKMHTSRRDAFRPINAGFIARVNPLEKKISFIEKQYEKKGKSKLQLKLFEENLRIGIVKAHPNMSFHEFRNYSEFDGLIIEGTGLGHAPVNEIDEFTTEHTRILAEIKKLSEKMPVVMTSQTIYGRVQMDVYSTGRALSAAGVVGNLCDMTPETAFIKLAWLLSNYPEEAASMIGQNLRGEISERTDINFLN